MPFHIAQIGSSFAAGPGIPPVADARARRSGANFASLVRQRLAESRGGDTVHLTDLSVSGATLPQLESEPQVPHDGRGVFPPQIPQIPQDADVVLVLGGGNDIGYIGGLFEDTLRGRGILGGALAYVLGGSGAPAADPDRTTESALAARYGAVLDAVHARAPGARVVVVEYVRMFGPDASASSTEFSAERVARHREVGMKLLRATRGAALAEERKGWCELVRVDETSAAHGLGSKDPWVNGFSWGMFRAGCAFHPNAEGMKGVAELVFRKFEELGFAKPPAKL